MDPESRGLMGRPVMSAIAAFLVMALALPVAGQGLVGVVVDARSGDPVAGASVALLDATLRPLATPVTAADGTWRAGAALEVAVAQIHVSAPGYAATTVEPRRFARSAAGGAPAEIRLVRLGDQVTAAPITLEARTVASWCGTDLDPESAVVVGRSGCAGVSARFLPMLCIAVDERAEMSLPDRSTLIARPPSKPKFSSDERCTKACVSGRSTRTSVRTMFIISSMRSASSR